MRLPLGNVCRAFSELDRFDDAQCAWYKNRAIRRHWVSMVLVGFGAVAAALLVIVALIWFEVLIGTAFQSPLRRAMESGDVWGNLVVVLVVCFPPVSGLITGLLIRDAWLRWAIRKELRESTCPKCEYQLLGLPVVAGVVRCPECGVEAKLDALVPPTSPG